MIPQIRNAPIRIKLIAIALVSAAVALLGTTLILLAQKYIDDRHALEDRADSVAKIIAANTQAALVFGDRNDAQNTLSTVSNEQDVIGVQILTPDGTLFASFESNQLQHAQVLKRFEDHKHEDLSETPPDHHHPDTNHSEGHHGYFHLVKPIEVNNRNIGSLHLQMDLSGLHRDIQRQALISVGIFLIAMLLAAVLAHHLQRMISVPIARLATAMHHVSDERNYSVRLKKTADDEIGTLIDSFNAMLTQIDAHETALCDAKNDAESASRAKSRFLATMSHEIRTPMNGVMGMAELLQNTQLDERQSEYTKIIRSSADSLLAIINDVLDFSKIEAGKLDLDQVEFDLREQIEDSVRNLTAKAREKGLDLYLALQSDLTREVVGDPGRLRQILTNLLSNAIKFTTSGNIILRARNISDKADQSRFRIEIQDTGIGIDHDTQSQIFDSFRQADSSTTRKFGGTGLGLAIAKELVHMFDGQIGVRSSPGNGSTFWFEIVLQCPSKLEHSAEAETHSFNDERVLIVERDPIACQILVDELLYEGLRPVYAGGPAAALGQLRLSIAQKKPFSVLLIDEALPGLYTSELATILRAGQEFPQLHTITMRYIGQDIYGLPLVAEETAVVSKPIRQVDLHKAITLALATPASSPNQAESDTEGGAQVHDESNKKPRILMAEDNVVNQVVASEMLASLGYDVAIVDDGEQAVEHFAKASFDLVLMDCQLPKLDGYDATRQIRVFEKENGRGRIPIIALTAYAMTGDRERALEAGMDDYLSKPYTREDIYAVLQRWQHAQAKSPGNDYEIDMNALQRLKAIQSPRQPDLLQQLLKMFAGGSEQVIQQMRDAINKQSRNDLRRAAHTLKSSSANLGAEAFAVKCRTIEYASSDGDWENLSELVESAAADVPNVVAAVDAAICAFENQASVQK